MMHKFFGRKLLPLALAALLLTACGDKIYGADYSARNDAYLRYAFGEDYTLAPADEQDGADDKATYWTLHYQDADGEARDLSIQTYDYEKYKADGEYASEEQFHDYWLLYYAYFAAGETAQRELFRTIVSKYYDIGGAASICEPEENVSLGCYCGYALDSPDAALYPYVQQALDPQTGLQVRGATLQSIAEDPAVIFHVYVTIRDKDIDAAPYIAAMEQIYADYLSAVRTPENYRFVVSQQADGEDGSQTVVTRWEKAALTGIGEFDAEARYGMVSNVQVSMMNELQEILKDRLK